MLLGIFSVLAQFERELIGERTRQALKYKKQHGTKTGRPIGHPRGKNSSIESFKNVLKYMIDNNVGQAKACLMCRYPKTTFQLDIQKYYKKYDTKNYKELLERMEKEQ